MVVFLGKGSALWRGVVGLCPGCPEGGEWVEGASGTQHLSPVLGGAGYRVLPWSDLMIRVVGPWISCCSCWALDLLCCCTRQGPIRLSSACGTFPRLVRCRVAAAKRVSSLLSSSAGVFSDPLLPAAMAMPLGLCLSICARSLPHEWRPSDEGAHPYRVCLHPGRRVCLRRRLSFPSAYLGPSSRLWSALVLQGPPGLSRPTLVLFLSRGLPGLSRPASAVFLTRGLPGRGPIAHRPHHRSPVAQAQLPPSRSFLRAREAPPSPAPSCGRLRRHIRLARLPLLYGWVSW